ncbi:hypothetical protein [Caulobacter sp. LARHSG274]
MATSSNLVKSALTVCAAALLLAGCASSDEMRALRQPAMPPVAVAKASPSRPFYRNIAIQEIQGAPEFRWFDGGAVMTTRPTRTQVLDQLSVHLEGADMLAPRLDAEYMLYVQFDELRGPDVWLGTDKLASARITFRLVRWRTNELVRERTVETSYRAQWSGITPDMVRAGIAGPIGVARDSADAPIGGFLGGALLLGYFVDGRLAVPISAAPLLAIPGGQQAALVGGPERFGPGFDAALVTAIAAASARGSFSELEFALAGGAVMGTGAAAGPAPVVRPVASGGTISSEFSGTARRFAATRGLIDLAFDQFMGDLRDDGSVIYKRAVSCRALNPEGYRGAHLAETADAYAVDCPGAQYNNSPSTQAYPTRF